MRLSFVGAFALLACLLGPHAEAEPNHTNDGLPSSQAHHSIVGSASPTAPVVNLGLYRARRGQDAKSAQIKRETNTHLAATARDPDATKLATRPISAAHATPEAPPQEPVVAPPPTSPIPAGMSLGRYFREMRADYDMHARNAIERSLGLFRGRQAQLERRLNDAEDNLAAHLAAYAPMATPVANSTARFLVERMVFKKDEVPVRYADDAKHCLAIIRSAITALEAEAPAEPNVAAQRRASLKALRDIESELKNSLVGYSFAYNWR